MNDCDTLTVGFLQWFVMVSTGMVTDILTGGLQGLMMVSTGLLV